MFFWNRTSNYSKWLKYNNQVFSHQYFLGNYPRGTVDSDLLSALTRNFPLLFQAPKASAFSFFYSQFVLK